MSTSPNGTTARRRATGTVVRFGQHWLVAVAAHALAALALLLAAHVLSLPLCEPR